MPNTLQHIMRRCSGEIYLNNKQTLRGVMFSHIACDIALLIDGENNKEFVEKSNQLYKNFMKMLNKNPSQSKECFNQMVMMSDVGLSQIFKVVEKLGEEDVLGEKDWDKNITNFEYEKGALCVEVQREVSSVVRF